MRSDITIICEDIAYELLKGSWEKTGFTPTSIKKNKDIFVIREWRKPIGLPMG